MGLRRAMIETLFEAGRMLAEAQPPSAMAPGPPTSFVAPAPAPTVAAPAGPAEREMPVSGPGGPVVDVLLCFLPIVFLVAVTLIKPISLPTSVSLPAAAVVLWAVRMIYFSSPPNFVNALVVAGFFEAITPLSIIFGAILLFQTMHHTKCLPWMMSQIKNLSGGHPVAEVFLISWAFAYMIEGASGFGTPVALSSPMMSELGHNPINVVTCGLIMNTLATQFGAVGTPIWFGFGGLGLEDGQLVKVGMQSSILVGVCAYIIPVLAARFLVPFRDLARNWLFILLSISSAVLPAIFISIFNYEFPSLIGGMCTLFGTAGLIYFKIGLRPTSRMEDHSIEVEGLSPSGSNDGDGDKEGFETDEVMHGNNLKLVEGQGLMVMPAQPSVNFPLTLGPRGGPNQPQTVDAAVDCDFERAEGGAGRQLSRRRSQRVVRTGSSMTRGGDGGVRGDSGLLAGAKEEEEEDVMEGEEEQALKGSEGGDLEMTNVSGKRMRSAASKNKHHRRQYNVIEDEVYLDDLLDSTARPVEGGDMEVSPLAPDVAVRTKFSARTAIGRTMPLWLTVVILLITRIPQLKMKGILQDTEPSVCLHLGSFGDFCVSYSVVLQLKEIFTEPMVAWKYEFCYIPFFLPFTVVSFITIAIYHRSFDNGVRLWVPFKDAASRVKAAVRPTLGALVLVQLIRQGGPMSPSYVIGYWLSKWMGVFFMAISAFLGALGSFFSGSTTVSNLTFGDIQLIAAESIGKPATTMLAIQTLGATMGNMVCINNIISAKAVMSLTHVGEGVFIGRTGPVGLLMGIIGEAIGFALTYLPFS